MTDTELFFTVLVVLGAFVSVFAIGYAWGKAQQEIRTFEEIMKEKKR